MNRKKPHLTENEYSLRKKHSKHTLPCMGSREGGGGEVCQIKCTRGDRGNYQDFLKLGGGVLR